MIHRAPNRPGAPGPTGNKGGVSILRRAKRSGFTLLEMCIVLMILALLVGLTMPSMESAFTEQAVRKDSHQLALMVKTAMIQSSEQHRTYIIDLSESSMALHPLGKAAAVATDDPNTASFDDTVPTENAGPIDVDVTNDLDAANKLQIPDPIKANSWVSIPDGTQWTFEPGELCKATTVRVARGEAWVQLNFNALTGDVENETFSLP